MEPSRIVLPRVANFPTLENFPELHHFRKIDSLYIPPNPSLKSLKGCPKILHTLDVYDTAITTLEHAPTVAHQIWLSDNTQLVSLKGCPQNINSLACTGTQITSLKHCCTHCTYLNLSYNNHLIMTQIWKHIHSCQTFECWGEIHPKSKLLGLLRVIGLTKISCHSGNSLDILKDFIPITAMSSIMSCKQKLIEAGFESNAEF